MVQILIFLKNHYSRGLDQLGHFQLCDSVHPLKPAFPGKLRQQCPIILYCIQEQWMNNAQSPYV